MKYCVHVTTDIMASFAFNRLVCGGLSLSPKQNKQEHEILQVTIDIIITNDKFWLQSFGLWSFIIAL